MNTVLLTAVLAAMPLWSMPPAETPTVSGVVAETMDSGGYTYILLKDGKSSQWFATPPMKAKKGERLTLQSGMVMKDFKSPSLKRSFKSIIFSGGPAAAASAPSADPHAGGMGAGHGGSGAPHGMGGAGDKTPAMGHGGRIPLEAGLKVEKAPGSDAYTVAELHLKSKTLDGKKVSVRGKVVKVSRAIMDRNWVHLQDGSGDAKKGTHDLTLTTSELPAVGEVAVFKGTLRRDKDIGMGNRFPVLVEDAARVK
ncbi:MAG: DNA-binding protein [Elusimicrobia bacterium]|nr:DNA-binding protein [Elusimicrobiota bacterium]